MARICTKHRKSFKSDHCPQCFAERYKPPEVRGRALKTDWYSAQFIMLSETPSKPKPTTGALERGG